MARQQSNKTAADLVNFHFSSSPPSQSHMAAPPPPRRRKQKQQYRRSVQDRASARRKASSSMFYLHSSADHAFVITRRSKQGYSFSGPDEAVSWEAVRTVKCLVPFGEETVGQETCPVCLDSFTCPRITKCGHCFCFSCLLRHVHTQTESNKSQAVKCPCCSLPLHIEDLRPVVMETVQPPRLHGKMTFVKLHRAKECSAPYLPQRDAYRHLSPHAAPTFSDRDAFYCRFNYVDPNVYQSLLTENQVELESALSDLQNQPSRHSSVELEILFLQMALESVRAEQRKAAEEAVEEQELAERYRQPGAGMYQANPERVFAKKEASTLKAQTDEATNSTDKSTLVARPHRSESMDSTDSHHSSGGKPRRERRLRSPEATMYLDQDTTHFYQSADGQLCFLSRFNMTCLSADFTASVPEMEPDAELSPAQQRKLRPFPDVVEGNILDKESVHLTPEVRKRLPFLSHLPLYTDIHFVEVDLNRMLSPETKHKFKAEMEKRRKKRKSKVNAEKRADRIAKQKEEARINELKTRIQRIDPSDEFFQVPEEPAAPPTGEEFGPALSVNDADDGAQVSSPHQEPQTPPLSFRAAAVSGLNPLAVTEDAFPSLSSSPPSSTAESRGNKPTWGSVTPGWHGRPRTKSVEEEPNESSTSPPAQMSKGKKSKGKKVLLFSTGGHRGAD